MKITKQRLYALLLILGSAFLLYRTLHLVITGNLTLFTWWVSALLLMEMTTDLASLAASVWWYRTNDPGQDRLPLRLATAVVFLHAFRVLIFVLGRTGPWINFDVRPEFHATHGERWSWTWVWFAAIMSILGMATVLLIWLIRRRKRKNR